MNIYIYSDESGVFDKYHNDYFVFAGLIFLLETDSNECARRYAASEKNIRKTEKVSHNKEVKAAGIEGSSKNKLFRSLDNYEKFGIIVDQQKVEDIHVNYPAQIKDFDGECAQTTYSKIKEQKKDI